MTPRLLLGLALIKTVWADCARPADKGASTDELFEKRITPLLKSPNASSCVQCHFLGVELKDYFLASSEKNFLMLCLLTTPRRLTEGLLFAGLRSDKVAWSGDQCFYH
jgi:hypothetical protein